MLERIFNPENWFFRLTGHFVDVVLLSLFWLLCSLPLFTLGPASAALYDTVVKTIRTRQENTPYRHFFQVFRREFKVGCLATVFVLLAGVWLYLLYHILYAGTIRGRAFAALYYAFLALLLLLLGALSYLFPVLSRFTFQTGGLFAACAKLAIAHLPTTVCLGVVTAAAAWACLRYWWPVLFLPALVVLLCAQSLEKIFLPHMGQENSGPDEPDQGSV